MKKPLNFLRVEQVRLLFVRLPEPVSPVGHGLNGVSLFPEPSDRLPDGGAAETETARQLFSGEKFALPLAQQGEDLFFRHAAALPLIRIGCSRSTRVHASAIFTASGIR